MKKAYLGIDIGSISTKGVVIDENNNIIASISLDTNGNPITATKRVLKKLQENTSLTKYKIVGVGTTGIFRTIVGTLLGTTTIKNEIIAHTTGVTSLYPKAQTIFDLGGSDSKLITLNNGTINDYEMNNLCSSKIGSFLSNQAKKFNIPISDFGKVALTSKNPTKISFSCINLAQEEVTSKIKLGHKKEDIILGLCYTLAHNYLSIINNKKQVSTPIVLTGGVSQNIAVVKAFETIIGKKIIVSASPHLMGALGVAIISRTKEETLFSFATLDSKLSRSNNPNLGLTTKIF